MNTPNKKVSSKPEIEFCRKYGKNIALLPLCQIANHVNPTHNHVNEIYNEYCQFSPDIQSKIMQLNNYPIIEFTIDNHSLLTKFASYVADKELGSARFLYAFTQYIPRSLSYETETIIDINPNIFPCEPNILLPNRTNCDLLEFIDDYLYKKRTGHKVEMPLDWMWDNMPLSLYPEKDLIFWYNLFIHAACCYFEDNHEASDDDVYLNEPDLYDLKTMEDLHFATLLRLYQTFIF